MTEVANGAGHVKKNKKRKLLVEVDGSQVNGIASDAKPSKAGRREAKRLKKQQQISEDEQRSKIDEGAPEKGQHEEGEDRKSAKAARKAERVRLKALKNTQIKGDVDATNATKEKSNPKEGEDITKSSDGSCNLQYQEDPSLTALPQSEVDAFLSKNHISINDPLNRNILRPIIDFVHLSKTATPPKAVTSGFKNPTPIQSAAWPFLLSGRDVVGVAETGSGKTLAFGVPCIRSITASPAPAGDRPAARAVIVSPTRELAVQIHTQIEQLATPASLSTVCVYGGVPKDQQRTALRTAHIIVATPGRLNDLINEGFADLSNVNYLVLDEADRMLDKGFEDEIRKIISSTNTAPSSPTRRQTLMFTATWPPSVRSLASTFLTSPIHISVGANNPTSALRANPSITQLIEVISPHAKEQRLLQILKHHHHQNKNSRILIFCLYKKEAARIEHLLRHQGRFHVAAIHGDMPQSTRQFNLSNFKSGACPLLVATDVAARGLDIPAVTLVLNVTFPLTVEDYVHRIGRTGRAGATGLAITLFTEEEKGLAGGLVNVLRGAGQVVPEELARFGGTVKRRGHEVYGAFYKDLGAEGGKKEGTKIRFDD